MPRPPEIGNVQMYPKRPLRSSDKNGFVLKFYCPIQGIRIRKNAGTRDRREARKIARECSQRLTNGEYIASGGAITAIQAVTLEESHRILANNSFINTQSNSDRSWESSKDQYLAYKRKRVRDSTYDDIVSRLCIAERIFQGHREDQGLEGLGSLRENCSLSALEYLQDRLLAGDECRYDWRSPMTVNTAMGAIMTFVRYCARHDWIDKVPILEKLEVENPMKGRPITPQEFEAMLQATPDVVGNAASESWQFVLKVIWSTAFRVGDVMSFAWNDKREIHPLWPDDRREYPSIAIPSKQKNRKTQEVPMLPELEDLLASIPSAERNGWIANPLPIDSENNFEHRPTPSELQKLKTEHSNVRIAEMFNVSETAVRKWLRNIGIDRKQPEATPRQLANEDKEAVERLTKERVGRIIGLIGQKAEIVVQEADEHQRKRLKFASAHDIRRGCAQRLINKGVSAESLKLVLRHSDFATTEKFYGAVKNAQSVCLEIRNLTSSMISDSKNEFTPDEMAKIRSLLSQI